MASQRPLDLAYISEHVLRLDFDMLLTATWAHLCEDEVTSGRLAFPITSADQLEGLFGVVRQTEIKWRKSTFPLAGPEDGTIPPAAFPIQDMPDFVSKVLMMIHVHHLMDPNPPPGKWHLPPS